jgi:CHAT domain-containing protein
MSSLATSRGSPALNRAQDAHDLVQARPHEAMALAKQALAEAAEAGDVEAKIAGYYALGWAQLVLGDAQEAARTVRSGIRLAERTGQAERGGVLRRLLANSLLFAGHTGAARREIELAVQVLSGRELARAQVHRVAIHGKSHSPDPETHRRVMDDTAKALRLLRRHGDELWEARLLNNRGVLHFDRGELDRAENDLRRAHALYARLGADARAVDAAVALAEVALLRGEVLDCLEVIEAAQTKLPPGYFSNLDGCRVQALSQARLLPEARNAALAYVERCRQSGYGDYVASINLDLASIALMSGDPAEAEHFARRAARSFATRGKPVNAAQARAVLLRAKLADGRTGRSSIRGGLAAANTLETAGWRRDALRTRLLVARIGLAVGSTPIARKQLNLARPLWTRGTVNDRIELCHVRALLRLAVHDPTGAERQLKQGLRLLDDYRAALGASELRATASGIGVELSQLGLHIAFDSQEPAKVLAWAERLRASALRLPAVRPPADRKLAALQVELRRAVAEQAAGRQSKLEAAIRARTRLVPSDGGATTVVPDVREATRTLGERVLVEYVELDGMLSALTMAGGRLTLHELGSVDAIAELQWLRFALARLARGRNTPAERTAALGSAQAAAAALDASLVEPLLPALGVAPLVLVPTGSLHALPWSALPSLRGRPLVVAPSLSVWLALDQRLRSRRRRTALIAGPRLRHSAGEVRELSALFGNPTVLSGDAATSKAALAALDGAALAHVACHGRFRSDSPLFSSLELADGPLNVYELQQLRRAPEVVVLSACDLATSDLHPGDELLGVAAALLAMGTRTIIASVVPVPDAASKRLMLAFHRNLLAGHAPASALARAQARAAVPGFVCLGSG